MLATTGSEYRPSVQSTGPQPRSSARPRSVAQKAEIAQSLRAKVWPLLESGKIAPVIFKTFPLAQAADAHRLMESSAHVGKIVLVTAKA